MKERTIRLILYALLLVGAILLASHLEYREIQEDKQAQIDCRVQDASEYKH